MPTDTAKKLQDSRQKLLDLTLRNRLLNFKPGNPDYREDAKGHKHMVLKGTVDAVCPDTQPCIHLVASVNSSHLIVKLRLVNTASTSTNSIRCLDCSGSITFVTRKCFSLF
jgi:hypothetical protein